MMLTHLTTPLGYLQQFKKGSIYDFAPYPIKVLLDIQISSQIYLDISFVWTCVRNYTLAVCHFHNILYNCSLSRACFMSNLVFKILNININIWISKPFCVLEGEHLKLLSSLPTANSLTK